MAADHDLLGRDWRMSWGESQGGAAHAMDQNWFGRWWVCGVLKTCCGGLDMNCAHAISLVCVCVCAAFSMLLWMLPVSESHCFAVLCLSKRHQSYFHFYELP